MSCTAVVAKNSSSKDPGAAMLAGYDRADFNKRLRFLLRIVVPTPVCKESILLALHTAALVLRTIFSLYMAALDGQLVKTIVERDLPAFLRAMFKWFAVGIPATITTAMIKFTENKLALAFRTRLTRYMMTKYMSAQTYYRVGNLDGRLNTVDQALTEDVSKFSTQLAHLYSQLTKPSLDVLLYSGQLYFEGARRFGLTAPVIPTCLAWFVVFATARVLRLVAPSFARRVAHQTQLEGELRFLHSRLVQNSEEVAFYRGEDVERGVLDTAYLRLAKDLNRFYRRCVPYNVMEGYLMKYVWGGTGMAMIGLPQFFVEIAAAVAAAYSRPLHMVGVADASWKAVGTAFSSATMGKENWLALAVEQDAPGRGELGVQRLREASARASGMSPPNKAPQATAPPAAAASAAQPKMYATSALTEGTGTAAGAVASAAGDEPVEVQNHITQSIGARTKDYVMFKRLLIDSSDAVERLMLAIKEVKELDGRMFRLTQVLEVFRDCEEGRYVKECSENKETYDITQRGVIETIEAKDDESCSIRLNKVPIVAPNGDVLLRELTIDIVPGRNILITGPNGAGKSSLFRVLGDVWPTYGGHLTRPASNKLFYIPQKPYLPVGTLRDQVIYPHTRAQMVAAGFTDDTLKECLRTVDLEYILDREGGFDAFRTDWKGALSGGEQQRVGLARLFYHRPKFAILDECTASVSIDAEARIFRAASDFGITLLTVAHRDTLRKYHTHRLALDGAGGYTFGPLDENASIIDPPTNATVSSSSPASIAKPTFPPASATTAATAATTDASAAGDAKEDGEPLAAAPLGDGPTNSGNNVKKGKKART